MAELHLRECDDCGVFHVNLQSCPGPADPAHDHSEIEDAWCCQACADLDDPGAWIADTARDDIERDEEGQS